MDWDLQWGPHLKHLEDMQAQSGITPKALLSRPTLPVEYHGVYEMFQMLHSCRQELLMVMPGPVPVTVPVPHPISVEAVNAYFEIVGGTDPEMRLSCLRTIRSMDSAYFRRLKATNGSAK